MGPQTGPGPTRGVARVPGLQTESQGPPGPPGAGGTGIKEQNERQEEEPLAGTTGQPRQQREEKGQKERQLHQTHLSTYCIPGTEEIAVSKTKAGSELTLWWEKDIKQSPRFVIIYYK